MPFAQLLGCLRCMLIPQLHHILDQVSDLMATLTVGPLATIHDTPHLAIQPDRTALVDTRLGASINATPQNVRPPRAIVPAYTVVELAEADAVLECTVADQPLRGNVLVVLGQAHCEAEVDLGVWVHVGSAELDGVAEAFRWTMHT